MIDDWCKSTLRCLNLDKTQDLKENYNNLEDCTTSKEVVKFAGFNLDSKLNWVRHVDKLSGKLSKRIL